MGWPSRGMESSSGTEIPMKDENDNTVSPKLDAQGKVVKSRLDEATLKEIASVTGGKYIHCNYDERGINDISNEILGMEKKEYQRTLQKQYINRFQYPLAVAIILLSIEFCIPEVRRRR